MKHTVKSLSKSFTAIGLMAVFSLVGFQAARGYGGGGGGSSYTAPYVRLSNLNGGETLTAGSTFIIMWSSGGNSYTTTKISLSTDGGSTYPTVLTAGTSGNGYYYWEVSDVSTTKAMIKLEGVGTNVSDVSDAAFTIVGTKPKATSTVDDSKPKAETPVQTQPATMAGASSDTPVTPEASKKAEKAAPTVDVTVLGTYLPASAAASNPTINTDKRLSMPVDVSAFKCTPSTLIKGSTHSVYFCGNDGKRYVFVNQGAFLSWYRDYSSVVTISDADLAGIPIGGNVTYKPGVRMVKIQSDPKVYVVARGGVLRWVADEAMARALYGASWTRLIDDVPDAFFVNYRIGEPITQ